MRLRLETAIQNGISVIRNFRGILVILALLLVACRSQLDAPASAPGNFSITPGDGQAVLNWDAEPGQIYSVYYQVGPDVSLSNYINLFSAVSPPFTITGLANQTQYAFIVNASNQGSVPGPSTAVVTVTPGVSGTGSSWTVGAPFSPSTMRGIAFGGHDFVAVGDDGAMFITHDSNSSSGISAWSQVTTLPVGSNAFIASVLFTGTGFVAMLSDGQIITSTDTVAWVLGTSIASTQDMTSIAYSNGTYVAVGLGGIIYSNTSANLSGAWVERTSGTSEDLFNVSYVNGLYAAVGQNGALVTSADGIAWTVRNANTTNTLYQVAYGANVYVAVGDGGTIISSPDGINWALQSNNAITAQNLYAIGVGAGSKFVTVGAAGILLYSTGGAEGTWTAASVGGADLNCIVSGAGVFVAVGVAGANVSGR